MTAEREERTQSPSPGPDADEGAGLCAGKGERAFQAEGPNEGPKLRPLRGLPSLGTHPQDLRLCLALVEGEGLEVLKADKSKAREMEILWLKWLLWLKWPPG